MVTPHEPTHPASFHQMAVDEYLAVESDDDEVEVEFESVARRTAPVSGEGKQPRTASVFAHRKSHTVSTRPEARGEGARTDPERRA